MKSPVLQAAPLWLLGVGVALAGVALTRLVAPECSPAVAPFVALAGRLTAFAGLGGIMYAVSRRLRVTSLDSSNPR